MTIFVRNLPPDVDNEDLKYFFVEYGTVTSAKIVRDHQAGFSRGFGYVDMPDEEAAQKAIRELDGGKVLGQEIRVMKALPKNKSAKRNREHAPQKERC